MPTPLEEVQQIQDSAFAGGVTVDISSSWSGTSFPVGTTSRPVNNLEDAEEILQIRGLGTIFHKSSNPQGPTLQELDPMYRFSLMITGD